MPCRPLFALLCLTCAFAAHAKHIYQYKDAQGVTHFTDVKPPDDTTGVKSSLVHIDPQPLLRSRDDGTDEDRTIVFVNNTGGAITVVMSLDNSSNVTTDPTLPARIVLPGRSETRALHIVAPHPELGYSYTTKYTYLPGDYRAQHDDSVRYQLPFPADRKFPVGQGFNGTFSHNEPSSQYAVDIGMPEGTPILAARDGVVMTVDNDFYGNGVDIAAYGDRANNVRIVHADGTMAVYAHLQLESAKVQVGEHVHAGQQIALSGDTGFSTGPHLHFCIQRNADMKMVSVPFQFTGATGDFTPVAGMTIGAQ